MTEPAALFETRGHVGIITLNRPASYNAVNADLSVAVGEALEEMEHDRNVWVGIITGAGDKAFSAGADLKEIAAGNRLDTPETRAWGFAGLVQHPVSVPLIAAVNGLAYGGGCEIVLTCDLAIAAEHARFGLPEVKRGILAAAGGVFRLPQQLPPKLAAEMMFTGEPIDAPTALAHGLVNKVVPADRLMDEAMMLAESICANAPLAVQASKRIMKGIVDGTIPSEDDAWTRNATENRALFASADAREGPRAFAEKRIPIWRAE